MWEMDGTIYEHDLFYTRMAQNLWNSINFWGHPAISTILIWMVLTSIQIFIPTGKMISLGKWNNKTFPKNMGNMRWTDMTREVWVQWGCNNIGRDSIFLGLPLRHVRFMSISKEKMVDSEGTVTRSQVLWQLDASASSKSSSRVEDVAEKRCPKMCLVVHPSWEGLL